MSQNLKSDYSYYNASVLLDHTFEQLVFSTEQAILRRTEILSKLQNDRVQGSLKALIQQINPIIDQHLVDDFSEIKVKSFLVKLKEVIHSNEIRKILTYPIVQKEITLKCYREHNDENRIVNSTTIIDILVSKIHTT